MLAPDGAVYARGQPPSTVVSPAGAAAAGPTSDSRKLTIVTCVINFLMVDEGASRAPHRCLAGG